MANVKLKFLFQLIFALIDHRRARNGGDTVRAADGELCVIAVTTRVCIEPQHE